MTSASKAAISRQLAEARGRTLALIEPLDEAQLNRVYSPILSPLAGTSGTSPTSRSSGWCGRIGERPPLHGELGRFYDAIENPRKTRGELPILRDEELRAYMAEVRERTLAVLEEVEISPGAEDPLLREGFVYEMLIAHELQHQETMLQLLELVDGYEPVRPDGTVPVSAAGPATISIPAGSYEIGAPATGFAYDNERPRHAVELDAFEIDRTPVTNGAYITYMEATGAEPPLYWERDDAGRWLDGARGNRSPVASDHPVVHVSHERPRPSPAGPAAGCRPSSSGRSPRRSSTTSARPGSGPAPSSALTQASSSSPTASTPRSSSATPTGSFVAPPGRPTRTSPGPASAIGTCRSGARSSPASASRGDA